MSGGPGKDGIPALSNPAVVSAGEGDRFLQAEDLVLGVVVNGEARAYPHGILWWHEIVNDVLGGEPIVVTFCPLTGSGIVYDPEIDGRSLNFGVSGLLFDNNLILFDRASDSLWSQMRLESVCGSFQGTRAAGPARGPGRLGRLEGAPPRDHGRELRHWLPAQLRRLPLWKLRPDRKRAASLSPERRRPAASHEGDGSELTCSDRTRKRRSTSSPWRCTPA